VHPDYSELLAQRLAEADDALRAAQSELDAVLVARATNSADDEHDPEGSTLSTDWSRLTGLVRAASARRIAIENAVARLATGAYGRCSSCGLPIAEGRLIARPEAELCIDCAQKSGPTP
jgi:DnaK suppressor protein